MVRSKRGLRLRALSYLFAAAMAASAVVLLDWIDREERDTLEDLREMHEKGLAPDPRPIFDDPAARTRRRAIMFGTIVLAVVARGEWNAWKVRRDHEGVVAHGTEGKGTG